MCNKCVCNEVSSYYHFLPRQEFVLSSGDEAEVRPNLFEIPSEYREDPNRFPDLWPAALSGQTSGTPSHTQQIFELLVLQVSIGVEMI